MTRHEGNLTRSRKRHEKETRKTTMTRDKKSVKKGEGEVGGEDSDKGKKKVV
jgi:hypothetical protein